jgi:signal transduction histidine kinase
MGLVEHLLALYAAVLVLNGVLSTVLWLRQRTSLFGRLVLVWVSGAIAFVAQGATSEGTPLAIALGFAFSAPASVALALLLGGAMTVSVPVRAYAVLAVACAGAALVIEVGGGAFWAFSLPIAVANAAPLLHMAGRTFARAGSDPSGLVRGLAVSCFLTAVHLLDFPLLRDEPLLAPYGFTGALLVLLALSITAPAVVLEKTAEERQRLSELEQLKSRFFANVSHELRTPLTVILASLEHLLASSAIGTDERGQLDVVRRNAARLLRLIDEMLDLSKIDAGQLRLNVAPFSIEALARSVTENNRPLATAKAIDLSFSPPERSIEDLHGDLHRLEIVLTNLVGNALKYTPDGGRVTVHLEDRADAVVVRVSDTGPGVPPEHLDQVFDRFYQVKGGDRQKGGVGIGLALAKDLTEMHGGELSVTSPPGEGATFSLRLAKGSDHFDPGILERRRVFVPAPELRRPEDALRPTLPPPRPLEERPIDDLRFDGRRARVLVVEDQDDLRAFIVRLFYRAFDVIEARDGDDGWERFERERPDIVVSDVMMPRRLGTDLCRAIKADLRYQTTPVILLTARVGSEATLEAYAYGADDFVAKPFHPGVLIARVRAQLQIRSLSLRVAASEKLAAVGTLAAGVAHEVKNPVNFILNAARTLLETEQDPATARQLLSVIEHGAQRIDGIVSALTAHVRPADGGIAAVSFDVRDGLEATLTLLEHRMSGVGVHRDYQTEHSAFAPPGPVNQILMNLLDNAVRSGSKNIWVRVFANDRSIQVVIADDGPGVPRDIAERIFDPFFTTRPTGEGTGLGLYLSRRMAKDCGGELVLESEGGPGARFRLDLPKDGPGKEARA